MAKSSYTAFLKHSQKKLAELKERLRMMSMTEEKMAKEKKVLLKEAKHAHEVRVTLDITSVIKAAVAILMLIGAVYLLYYIKDLVILFLVALFLSAALNPSVDSLQKMRIPRSLGIFLMYVVVLGVVIFIFTSLIPIIAEQITSIAFSIRDWVEKIITNPGSSGPIVSRLEPWARQLWENIDQAQILNQLTTALNQIGSQLTSFAGNAIGAVFAIFNGIFNLILVLMITFFMVMNKDSAHTFFQSLFPTRYSAYISQKTQQISVRIGEWLRGQMLLAMAMGIFTFIILSIVGINYALTLSMVSAIGEFVPYIGPLIMFLSATLIALNQDPILVVWLIGAYMIIQFVESYILVPLIIGKTVELNPIVILFALMIGATLGTQLGGSYALGLVGMIVAVPLANIISLFVEDYTDRHK